MARWLQVAWIQTAGSTAALVLAAAALWQSAGCTVPPPEPGEELENLPPVLEWDLALPTGLYVPHKLQKGVPGAPEAGIQFDLSQALYDPEGDYLQLIWYWTARIGGEVTIDYDRDFLDTFTLRPCEEGLGDAGGVEIAVAVSDRTIQFVADDVGHQNPPIVATPQEGETEEEAAARIVYRAWEVVFIGGGCQ